MHETVHFGCTHICEQLEAAAAAAAGWEGWTPRGAHPSCRSAPIGHYLRTNVRPDAVFFSVEIASGRARLRIFNLWEGGGDVQEVCQHSGNKETVARTNAKHTKTNRHAHRRIFRGVQTYRS